MPRKHTPVTLTPASAREIREAYAEGQSIQSLAVKFRVSETTIRDVLRYETWGKAGGPKAQLS